MPQAKKKAPPAVDACLDGPGRDLCLLYELTTKIDRESDPARLNELILEELAALFGAQRALLLLKEAGNNRLTLAAQRGPGDPKLGQRLERQKEALEGLTEFQMLNPGTPLAALLNRGQKPSTWAALPLKTTRQVMGLVLLKQEPERPFARHGRALLNYLGHTMGRAVEHTRLMKQARESEQRYRRIFEGSKDTLYETTKEGKFVDVNQAGVELFKFNSREELLQLDSIASLYYRPEDRDKFMQTIESQGYVKDYEVTFVNKLGEKLELLITSNVRRDESGRVIGYEGIIKDITPYKTLLKKLSESESKYRLMVENSADGIGIYAREGFVFANKAFLDMFGYQEVSQIRGMDILQFIAPGSRGRFLKRPQPDSRLGSQPVLFEGQGIRKDGSLFYMEMSEFPTIYEGQEARQITFRDITEKKRMEEQLIQSERLAATGKLAFDIAHEINNPLGGIITYTHLVLEELEEGSLEKQNVEKILKLANRCKIIVKGLLDFARSESHQKERVDINGLIKETLYLIQGHVIFKNVKVVLDLQDGLPAVMVVRGKLEQVFLNMIVNAAEAMEGQGTLTVATSFQPSSNIVQISFKDTGHGVDPEHLQKMFEPFFTTKQRGRGTGLGLSISHGIIKQHHGNIHVQSQPGKGTTFVIELPV